MANETMTLDECLARLEEFRGLKTNWDSYGAEPMTDAAIRQVRAIVEWVYEQGWGVSLVVPCPNGGTQLEFDVGSDSLEVEVGPDTALSSLVVRERSNVRLTNIFEEITDFWRGKADGQAD